MPNNPSQGGSGTSGNQGGQGSGSTSGNTGKTPRIQSITGLSDQSRYRFSLRAAVEEWVPGYDTPIMHSFRVASLDCEDLGEAYERYKNTNDQLDKIDQQSRQLQAA